MGKNLSPYVKKELRNLDKDPESRKSAMKALQSYIKDLDSRSLPEFLEHVSETKKPGSSRGEYTISLFELLARVHGPGIVPQIDKIMDSIIKNLSSNSGHFPLHQACSKVVIAIGRYGIQPTTPESNKREIILSLANPLADALVVSQESLSSGAALCLKLLVDSDNWRYASSDTVDLVCSNVARALQDKPLQASSYMGLIMSLARHNPLLIEGYSTMLLKSWLRILDELESNHQQRLNAIQMINFLMKSLDSIHIFSELEHILLAMEKCQHDQIGYVKGAAFEALQTANKIMKTKATRMSEKIILQNDSDQHLPQASPGSSSPASCVSSAIDNEQNSLVYKNGGMDISRRDGISRDKIGGVHVSLSSLQLQNQLQDHCEREVSGFVNENTGNGQLISANPSSLTSNSNVRMRIFATPRRLIHSLQDPINRSANTSMKTKKLQGTCSRPDVLCSKGACDRGDVSHIMNAQSGIYADSPRQESISSTGENVQNSLEEIGGKVGNLHPPKKTAERAGWRGFSVDFSLFVMFVAFIAAMLGSGGRDCCNLVPT